MTAAPSQSERRKANPEFVAFITSGTPEAHRHIALAVHGISDAYRCPTPDCGRPYEYPHSVCQGCRRPHQRVCSTSGCGEVIKPPEYGDIPPYCAHCVGNIGRKARAESFGKSSIPPRERQAAQSWEGPLPQQAQAVRDIEYWLQAPVWTGRKDISGIDSVYLAGLAGRGKSVVAAFAVKRAFVDLGLVSAFHWHTQTSIEQLFLERFARGDTGDSRSEGALHLWRALVESPLLVLDDLFTKALSPAFSDALSSLIRDRLDQRRPTLVTSNKPPLWHDHFADEAGRITSRWRAYGHDITIEGRDLRGGA